MKIHNARKKLAVLGTIVLAFAFLPVAAAQDGNTPSSAGPAQAADEIDYSNLSIEAALRRLLEVDPQIKIKKLIADRARLAIKGSRIDAWIPKLQFSASGIKPFSMATHLSQYHGPFFGQQFALDFSFDTNSLHRISREKKANDVVLAEIQESITERVRELVDAYYDLAAAQKGYKICLQAEKDIKELLNQRKKDPVFSDLDESGGINYLSLITEKRLSALNRVQSGQRRMKSLLDLEKRADLIIVVNGLPENVEQVKSLVEEAGLRRSEYKVDVLKEKCEQAKIAEKIALNPLLKFIWVPAFGLAEGQNLKLQTKLTNICQLNLFLTDFGQTHGTRKVNHLKTQISELEILKAERDLEYSDFLRRSELVQLEKKIDSYRDYIVKAESALKILKERMTFSFDTLLEISDQLLEARYALKQMLTNYLVAFSKLTGKEPEAEKVSPEFQELTLEGLLTYAEKKGEKLTDAQILEKTVQLEQVRKRVAKLGYLPKLVAATRIENDNIGGVPQQTTKTMLMLEGQILGNKIKYSKKEAEAALKVSLWQVKVFENMKLDAILTNYLQALRLERTIGGLSEIKQIKDGLIQAMAEDMKSKHPRYAEAEILPLTLQQMELDRTIADLEILLALAKYNLKKWANIPLNEKITLKKMNTSIENEDKDFLTMIIKRILPDYDAEAPVNAASSGVESGKAAEAREATFEGIAWRVKGEIDGADFDVWKKPESSVTLSLILPWENHNWRISKADAVRKRLGLQLNYAWAQKDLAVEKWITTERYSNARDVLAVMRRKVANVEHQLKITQELFDIGARTRKEIDSVKLEVIAAKFQCDEAYFDYLYACAKEMIFSGMISREEKGKLMILSSLQEAIDLALKNNKEIKVFEDILKLEEETLRYYTTLNFNAIAAGDFGYVRSKSPKSDELPRTGVAAATVNISLINRLLAEEQRKRIELAKMDLEREKFKVASDVVGMYTDYLNAMAEYSAIHAESSKEKAILESMAKLLEIGFAAQIDYLKQEGLVQLLAQKERNVRKSCEIPRKFLGVLVGGFDLHFSNVNLEIYDSMKKRSMPVADTVIRGNLISELLEAQKTLAGPLNDELSKRVNLETGISKLDTQRIATQIKSVGVKAGYSFLTHYLGDRAKGETTFSQFDQLGLNLISDKAPKKLAEFISLNTTFKVYDAAINAQAKIGSVEQKITEMNSRAALAWVTQQAEQLFDEYQNAVQNYQNWVRNAIYEEESTRRSLERAKESGKLTLVRQMEIKQNLLNNRMKKIAAFYKAMRLKNELDQYLRRYTGKGFEDFVKFKSERSS